MGGPPTLALQGTLIWVPYGTRIDSATNVLMPAQPVPGHQFVVMQVPAMRMNGRGSGGEGMVPPYAVPAPGAFPQGHYGEQIHYPPAAAGQSWRRPSVDIAYIQPPTTSYQAPLFSIPNAPPPFENTGMAPLEEQLAPEEQAAAQQSEGAGVYAEGGALCDAPLESFAIMAEQLREHTVSKSGVSTPVGPPLRADSWGWQSAVLPEPASNDKHVPPPPASSDGSCPASSEDPGGSGGSQVCRRRYGGCIPAGRMDQGGACRPGQLLRPCKGAQRSPRCLRDRITNGLRSSTWPHDGLFPAQPMLLLI
ncbi:uncharacterized protein LOC144112224 isoform X2 [Amblyomma americanum]